MSSRVPSKISEPPPKDIPTEIKQISRQIEKHKQFINELKSVIHTIENRKSTDDFELLKSLVSCFNQEMKKLNSTINMAIAKHSEYPVQPWRVLSVPTTLEEDMIPLFQPSAITDEEANFRRRDRQIKTLETKMGIFLTKLKQLDKDHRRGKNRQHQASARKILNVRLKKNPHKCCC